MVTSTISVRIPELIRNELDEYTEEEHLSQLSESVRKLILIGLQRWREERAIELLQNEEITFNEAADIARMDPWSFADLLNRSGVIWVKATPVEIERDIEDAVK